MGSDRPKSQPRGFQWSAGSPNPFQKGLIATVTPDLAGWALIHVLG